MHLTVQKRLAAHVLKCSEKKVAFDPSRLEEIKEAITKADVRNLIKRGAIIRKPDRNTSRGRARELHQQKVSGKRRGHGSRKGGQKARTPKKKTWMNSVRLQRGFIRLLRDKKVIDQKTFRLFYVMIKSGVFRSKRHIKLYMEEHGIGKK